MDGQNKKKTLFKRVIRKALRIQAENGYQIVFKSFAFISMSVLIYKTP